MNVLKMSKNIFKINLSKAEQKAADDECKRILTEWQTKHQREIDAMILWRLHNTFGWGPERLWRFYSGFHDDADTLVKKYELKDTDDLWIATQALKEYGINLEDWEKKIEEQECDHAN